MKSMKQMQEEMLAQVKPGQEWPKPVVMGLGILALAWDQEQYDALLKSNAAAWKWGIIGGIIFSAILFYAINHFCQV